MKTLINAHGPDHGLSVEVFGDEVEIRQWFSFPERNPDTGEWEGGIQSATIDLWELLEEDWQPGDTLEDTVIEAATRYLSRYGGDTDIFNLDRVSPCDEFGLFWGKKKTDRDPKEWACCPNCDQVPEFEGE